MAVYLSLMIKCSSLMSDFMDQTLLRSIITNMNNIPYFCGNKKERECVYR